MRLLILLCLVCFTGKTLADLPQQYQLVDLGILGKDSSEMHSINNKGEICGAYEDIWDTYAYVWSKDDSNYKSIRSPNKIFITNSSVVYGSYYDWVSRGFWNLDQETLYKWENPFNYFTYFNCNDIGYPEALYLTGGNIFDVILWSVNDLGQLLVMDKDVINRNNQYQIWVYDNDKFNKIYHPYLNAAIRINNQSQILGFYFDKQFSSDGEPLNTKGKKAVIYNLNDGQVSVFNTSGETWAADLNDLGEVAGMIKKPDGDFIGFFGTPDHHIEIENFSPSALNNCGRLIGKIIDGPNQNAPAIWENGELTLLNSLVSLIDDKGNEWTRIDNLVDINDSGEIIGQGLFNGKPHGFLLIPL